MWIEDEALRVFCEILSEVYADSYIEPSIEWTKFSVKELDREFERFKAKKRQIEEASKQDQPLHFGFEDYYSCEMVLVRQYEQMSDFLELLGIIHNGIELKKAYLALRWLLEEGVRVPTYIHEKFKKIGLAIDASPVNERDKKHIVIQAISQVLAFEGDNGNNKQIKKALLNFDSRMKKLSYLNEWESVCNYDSSADGFEPKDRARTIDKLIASVNPKPKGRPPKSPKANKEIVLIPGIFKEIEGITHIHFRKLLVTICYIAVMLSKQGRLHEEILKHPIFIKYQSKVPVFLHSLLEMWVKDTLQKLANF